MRLPYCLNKHIYLDDDLIVTKRCKEKKCPYYVFITQVYLTITSQLKARCG